MTTDPGPATRAGEPAATEPAPGTGPTAGVEHGTAHPNVAGAATVAVEGAIGGKGQTPKPKSRRNLILVLIAAIIAVDILDYFIVPPFPLGEPGKPVTGIGDLIMANLEFPAPHLVWELNPPPAGEHHALPLISADISIPNTIFTMWIVMAILLLIFIFAGTRLRQVPGRLRNAVEFIWESLENWAVSLGGPDARRHIPLFAAFFLFILFSNWSGLLPFFGKIEALRAPTSDVNVTIGLALVAFFVLPPFPLGQPGKPVTGIGDLIMANLEFPAPHLVWELNPPPAGEHHALPLISADISIPNTIFTM